MKMNGLSKLSSVVRGVSSSFRPLNSSFQRKLESRGAGSRHTFAGPAPFHFHPLVRPSPGTPMALRRPESRGGRVAPMAPRPFQQPAPFSYLCVPAAAGVQRWGGENVARGLVPRLGGEQPAHTTFSRPIHPKILDTQHRYSVDRKHAPYPDTGPESRGGIVAPALVPGVCLALEPTLHRSL